MENGQEEKAQRYITEICEEIEAQKVQNYCENEAANLILSSFVGRADRQGIRMAVKGSLSETIQVEERDLCVLLSNALENALHACLPQAAAGKECTIDVQFHEREGKLFLQVINPCMEGIRFKEGIPISDQPGHGLGMQSICAIAERYHGIYSFLVQENLFILRLSL
jgi:sensor histidine kinase regulating citrate/malate metabolism